MNRSIAIIYHLLFSLLLLLAASPAMAAVHYVTPSGAGNMSGSSWANPAPGSALQAVIDAALPGDEVWITCGEYIPTTTLDRSASFHMRNGIAIYGSFMGTETLLSDRVLHCGPCSILSGEIGAPGTNDNCYTVVWNEELDSTAILDGFRIVDGNDDRNPTSDGLGLGGGLYNHGYGSTGFCSPVIRHCIFMGNSASWGGGAFNNGYAGGHAEPTYINCIFTGNHGYVEAGGMDSYGVGGNASPTLYNCLFFENTSATNVGAMYAWGGNNGNCEPTLINCAFVNNHAQNGYGGAFIADNLDENGQASSGNCVVTLRNCIVWNNTDNGSAPQFYVRGSGAQVQATYSDIDTTGQTGQNVVSGPGTGNIFDAPLFVNINDPMGADACWMTGDDGMMPVVGSPVINTGTNTGIYATDLTGSSRIGGGITVDMGPYESLGNTAVEDTPESLSFELWPNPAGDRLHLRAEHPEPEACRVLNVQGKEVLARRWRGGEMLIEVESLPPGLYIVQYGSHKEKFIKL